LSEAQRKETIMSQDTRSITSRRSRRSLLGAGFAAVAVVALPPFDPGPGQQRLAGRGGGEIDTPCGEQADVSPTGLNPLEVRDSDGHIVHRGP
jgi:hypothetical protein